MYVINRKVFIFFISHYSLKMLQLRTTYFIFKTFLRIICKFYSIIHVCYITMSSLTAGFKIHWYFRKMTLSDIYCKLTVLTVPFTDFYCILLYISTDQHCAPMYVTVQFYWLHCTSTERYCTGHWPLLFPTVQDAYQHYTPLYRALTSTVPHCTINVKHEIFSIFSVWPFLHYLAAFT